MGFKRRNGIRSIPEVRRAMRAYRKLKKGQRAPCVVCGRDWKWYGRFHVHHLYPVSYFPEKAADEAGYRWVHSKCHLVVGHGGKWSSYQSRFDELAELTRAGLDPGCLS
jgi:hypothetical protein